MLNDQQWHRGNSFNRFRTVYTKLRISKPILFHLFTDKR